MGKTTTRKMEFETLFARHGKEPDWKFLSHNFADMADHEWTGLLQSINLILSRRTGREREN
ncbi:MAG TPA: hypothetical protein VLM75_14570 [Spirochaetota bacterium]|nr:hypothetical protein [Spirochaetota bacterium]